MQSQKISAFLMAAMLSGIGNTALAQNQPSGGSYTTTFTVTGEKPGGFNVTAIVEPTFTAVGANPAPGTTDPKTAQGSPQPPAKPQAQNPPAARTPAAAAAPAPQNFNQAVNGLAGQLRQQQQQIANLLQSQQQAQAQNANAVAQLRQQQDQMQRIAQDFLGTRVDRIARDLQRTMYLNNTPRDSSDRIIDAIRNYLMSAAQSRNQGNNSGNPGGFSSPNGNFGNSNNSSGMPSAGMSDQQMEQLASKLEDTLKTKLSDDVAAKVTEQLKTELSQSSSDLAIPTTVVRTAAYDYITPAEQASQMDDSQAERRLQLLEESRDICNRALSDKTRTPLERKNDRMFMMQLALKFRAMQDDATDAGVRSALDKDITACVAAANPDQ